MLKISTFENNCFLPLIEKLWVKGTEVGKSDEGFIGCDLTD